MQEKIDQLWQLAYSSFNRTNEAFQIPGIMGANQASGEVGRRLMQNLAELKRTKQINKNLIGPIVADILVAESQGWITNETSARMQELIDEMLGD